MEKLGLPDDEVKPTGYHCVPNEYHPNEDEVEAEVASAVINGKEVKIGDFFEGTVVSIEKYGIFVYIPSLGTQGFVHLVELSNSYISDASKAVEINQNIKVKLIRIIKSKNYQFHFSKKQAETD